MYPGWSLATKGSTPQLLFSNTTCPVPSVFLPAPVWRSVPTSLLHFQLLCSGQRIQVNLGGFVFRKQHIGTVLDLSYLGQGKLTSATLVPSSRCHASRLYHLLWTLPGLCLLSCLRAQTLPNSGMAVPDISTESLIIFGFIDLSSPFSPDIQEIQWLRTKTATCQFPCKKRLSMLFACLIRHALPVTIGRDVF